MNSVKDRLSHAFLVPVLCGVPVVFVAPLLIQPYTLSQLCIFAILALSLGLIWGFGGILCFGQGAFFAIGAYSYVVIVTNLGFPWLSLIFAILFTVAVAAALGAMMFYGRLGDVYLAVVTLVFTLILNRFMNSTAGPEYHIGSARLGGFNGIPGFQMLDIPWNEQPFVPDTIFYFLCIGLLLVTWIFCRWLLSSHFGRIMVAVRENERRVEFSGYDTRLYKTATFAIGAGLAGLAGALYANWAAIDACTVQPRAVCRSHHLDDGRWTWHADRTNHRGCAVGVSQVLDRSPIRRRQFFCDGSAAGFDRTVVPKRHCWRDHGENRYRKSQTSRSVANAIRSICNSERLVPNQTGEVKCVENRYWRLKD